MRRKLTRLFFILLLALSGTCYAQLDTEFWFVVPEICKHNGAHDRPISLIVSSLNDVPVTVTVSQPANPSFSVIIREVQPHSAIDIDLRNFIDLIENRPADNSSPHSSMNYDQVFNKGLLITASDNVSVAYFIKSGNFYNTEYYALKGQNALGKEFFVPGQNEVDNTNDGGYANPRPIDKFDIVATEDNTTVTIYPRAKNIMQHHTNNDYNNPFTIQLNKGETYCCVAVNNQAANHLYGTRVVASEKIAITVTDDMLDFNWGGEDVAGDQIVPNTLLGTEYVAVKGEMNGDRERVYVLATEDATQVFVNGSANPAKTFNKGQLAVLPFSQYSSSSQAMSFKTNNPVSVWQLTGFGNEFGGAILPHIYCTGSKTFSYTRTDLSGKSSNSLKMNVTVPKEHISKFEVRVNNVIKNNVLTASQFRAVPGRADWMYATITIPTSTCPVGATMSITNEANFHVGVFEGGSSGGCSYGFFTDFAMGYKLELATNHSDDIFCEGDSLTFIFNRNDEILSKIIWDGPNGFHTEGDSLTFPSVTMDQNGTFRISGEMDPSIKTCGVDYAEVDVKVMAVPHPDLGPDTTICDGNSVKLDATCEHAERYEWATGETGPTITVDESGEYSVTAYNGKCEASDTINVILASNPEPFIGIDSIFCDDFSYTIGTRIEDATYKWSTGDTSAYITVSSPGAYYVLVDSLGCKGSDTVLVTQIFSPVVNLGEDSLFCDNVYKVVDAGVTAERYEWNTGATDRECVANYPGDFWCKAYNYKCWGADTVHFDIIETPTIYIAEIGDLCADGYMSLEAQTEAEYLEWNTGEMSPSITITTAGTYMVKAANGPCMATAQKVIQNCPCSFFIPNSFTPNDDGLNDVWGPSVISENLFSSFTIYVFDRWGKQIHKLTSVTETWDGRVNGKLLPGGVYSWVAHFTCATSPDELKIKHGSVTIVR
ncbi:MAG: gliding motility-associated C-terminal domain-containing protein [Bacteroidales bacterium]|nr:gliding motility-associated C-terminal domain-containing protein [Bacteroidales bacterium]